MKKDSFALIAQNVEEAVLYYEDMTVPDGNNSMWLGLFMSRHFQKLINQTDPDLEEVKLFAKALEKNGDIHGIY